MYALISVLSVHTPTIKAVNPEVVISVDAKCCAGVTPESHANALAAMKACQIQVEE